MGFALSYRVEAIRCEYRTCGARFQLASPLPIPKPMWADVVPDLAAAVREGWAVVLLLGLKTYCPTHRDTAAHCSCVRQSHPERKKRCVVHCESAGEMLWNHEHVPAVVDALVTEPSMVGGPR